MLGVRRPRPLGVLVTLTAAGAGLLFATSATTAQGTDLRSDRRLQLAELIGRQRGDVERAAATAGDLRRQVAQEQSAAAAGDARVAQVQRGSAATELAAGLTAVEGPGLTVQLDDAPPTARSSDPDDLVVHQQDVQAVVNGLWAGGAEAVTLMGQRVISTSAVRCVGNTLVLQGQVYGPPFVVTAIGDARAMRTALDREPGVALFRRYVEGFGLGYRVEPVTSVRMPPYDGPLDLPHVQPPS